MRIPKYCRNCQYRAGENAIHICNYALITGLTRRAQSVGDGCDYKRAGKRLERRVDIPSNAKITALESFESMAVCGKPPVKAAKPDKPQRKYRKIDSTACETLYRQGYSDRKLSDAAGVTVGAIRAWRARRGLPNNYERHPEGGGQGNAEFEESKGIH